jgi:uncharacterized protein
MKFLLLIVVLLVAVAWVMGRGKRRGAPPPGKAPPKAAPDAPPAPMLACSHCGVHLPRSDAAFDASGRPYCGAEHRVAGPR